ncbi:phosphoribosyltransferase [Bradyrhizobium sp. WSM3983]|uniref:phosphoribosyltransferase family protein n=1 Tax=Bradyrhizobium sp. WSM3983 TaxID=1038867 RepID=UPI000423BDFC|nr:phosphoribosyltransferase [Bradyrhizobium sp. WSM3983]
MSKSDLIDTILTFVPATRRLDDKARENLERLSEGQLTSLAEGVADAAAHARKLLREEVSETTAKAALTNGTARIREARTLLAEANSRLQARKASEQLDKAPLVRPVVHKGWEVPFAPTIETASAHFASARLSEQLLEKAALKLGGLLVDCLAEIEVTLGNTGFIGVRFRDFLQSAFDTNFMNQFLKARTTSMLLESWDLLLERRLKDGDAESLLLEAQFEAVMREARNEIAHKPSVYDPHLLAEHEDVVIETRAIDGLALLGSRLLDYKPDLLVSLDRGGQVVGKLLDAEFGQDLKFGHALVSRFDGLQFSETRNSKARPARIVIVDDIARSGEAISEVRQFVCARYPSADVRAMVIVGTSAAKQRLGEEVLYMPNMTLNLGVRVPWKSGGNAAFRRLKDAYVLGSAEDELKVSKDIFERMVRRYQAARHKPTEP